MRHPTERSVWYYLTFVGQLGLSLAAPIVLAAAGASWLAQRFSLGGWVVLVGILLGVGGAAVSFMKVVRAMCGASAARKQEDEDA